MADHLGYGVGAAVEHPKAVRNGDLCARDFMKAPNLWEYDRTQTAIAVSRVVAGVQRHAPKERQ